MVPICIDSIWVCVCLWGMCGMGRGWVGCFVYVVLRINDDHFN